jgi:4-hydroxy-3-methylbut-2-enyl diphosphate reductase
MVERTLIENPGIPIFTLGPLIHNPRVVDEFRKRGVTAVDDPSQAPQGIAVIRAHGIGPVEREECVKRGLRLVDATCPHVIKAQEIVRKHAADGFHAVIVGDAGHGEVLGLRGCAGSSSVISTAEEAEGILLPPKCFVVGQSTFKSAVYRGICGILLSRRPDIAVFDTICAATETRQESLRALAKRVDALLVVGGMQSANTRWLFRTALESGKPSWHIEGAADIPEEISQYASVGISAGASTPDVIIGEVETRLLAM